MTSKLFHVIRTNGYNEKIEADSFDITRAGALILIRNTEHSKEIVRAFNVNEWRECERTR